ncbi:MAG: phenylalanine--tRNA ligase subunit beta [Clostridiales bacterium]|nr:phenylalanine--tRNA ligase subunit beta [Clostridiales bacterium]
MNISFNLLKNYIDLPENITPEQIAYDLTMRTVEVEDIIKTAEKFHNIVVGEIKELYKHPNADSLTICMVDCGLDEDKQIVCGGTNLHVGHKVCVSMPGANVVWHGEGDPVPIKESKLRGEKSFGMICAAAEVYLNDFFKNPDERIILDFTEEDVDCKVGQNVSELVGMDDTILKIDNKSLSNRPDLWGHYGVARELAAIYKLPFKEAPNDIPQGLPEYPVDIQSPEQCYRYAATKIENVYIKESPAWMKTLITNAGMRPINAIVDITNYVMLSVGQPLHAFDSSHVEGDKIVVRSANEGEKLLLLDDLDLDLSLGDLVICDTVEPMALAGIKGGKKDSILSDTTDVILEAASFAATGIRRTTKRFDEKTDASIRYEKGIDTQRVDLGISLALTLFKDIYPECKITAFGEAYPYKTDNIQIDIEQEFLDVRLGTSIATKEIEDILTRLGYFVNHLNGTYHCTVPTWRSTGDVSIKDDILGDIARLIGYEYFDAKPLPVNFEHSIIQPDYSLARKIKEYLSFRCGFFEAFTYPWVEEKFIKAARINLDKAVKLSTPPSPETAFLRSSLIPGMLDLIDKNSRNFDEFSVFESAQVFEKGEYHPSSNDETLPIHKNYVTGVVVGDDIKNLFLRVKGIIEGLSGYCQCESIEFCSKNQPSWSDSKVWLNICSGEDIIGDIGLISLASLTDSGIKNTRAAAFEFDADKLTPYPSRTNNFEHLPHYPLVEQDLSLVVDETVTWNEIKESIKYMVKDLKFVEEYRGEQIPEGKKSVMLSLKIGNDNSTMTTKQIEKKMNGIIKLLKTKCHAELR